jgi:hypothetical protein
MNFYKLFMFTVVAVGQLNLQLAKADSNAPNPPVEYDVYVSGYGVINGAEYQIDIAKYWKNGTGSEGRFAKYWKNGIEVTLTDGKHDAYAEAIAISGNDVYVVGSENHIAKLWKNSTAITLAGAQSNAKSIVISDGKVYIAGNKPYPYNEHNAEATYWKYTNSLQTVTTNRKFNTYNQYITRYL